MVSLADEVISIEDYVLLTGVTQLDFIDDHKEWFTEMIERAHDIVKAVDGFSGSYPKFPKLIWQYVTGDYPDHVTTY